MIRIQIAALGAVLALLIPAGLVHADAYDDASRLFRQGNQSAALEKIEVAITANPRDARARFLKGLILTEQNKPNEAIAVFTALTVDYPELPEPYNNLAVLYAAQGQYDKARGALEMAIRTHPSYAVAHENLGDVYAKMASQAYDKALQLDRANAAAQTKLALIKDLFSSAVVPGKTIETTAAAPAASPPATVVEVKPVAPPPKDSPAAKARAETEAVLATVNTGPKPGRIATPMPILPTMRPISRCPAVTRARLGKHCDANESRGQNLSRSRSVHQESALMPMAAPR